MRTLEQIANDNFVTHTTRDIEVMEVVRSETVAELIRLVMKEDPQIAYRVQTEFWLNNPRGR